MIAPVSATLLIEGIRKLGFKNKQISKKDLQEIAAIIHDTNSRAYIKKNLESRNFSLICTEKATYILCKTHLGHKRSAGGEKSGTIAIQIPRDQTRAPKLVYQLVSRDHLKTEDKEALAKEFEVQEDYAQKGIAPHVFDTFAYTKTRKDGSTVEKLTAFVEPFDSDLYAFDPLMKGRTFKLSSLFKLTTLSHEQVFAVAEQVASYLQLLHADNVAHRDIGTENVGVWFTRKTINKLCLTDFKTLAPSDSEPLLTYGHFEYSAPEYFSRTANIDEKAADMYALGILLSTIIKPEGKRTQPWEPSWIITLADLKEEAMAQDVDFYEFVFNSQELAQVLSEQLAYRPTIRPEEARNIKTFNQAVISWCVHPNPAERLTAHRLVELCNAYKAQHK